MRTVTKAFLDPLQALAALDRHPDLTLAKADVAVWMQSADLQVLAMTDVLVDQWPDAIVPSLTSREVDDFKREFYRRCLRENPQVDGAPSRDEASWELSKWLRHLIDAPDGGEEAIVAWRDWLAEEYRDGDASVRECLTNSVLTHAFERPEIRRLFDSWTQDAVLRDADAKAADEL